MDPTTPLFQNLFSMLIAINFCPVEAQLGFNFIDRIRLVNGTTHREGRVEVLIFGEWGTICDDSWDILDGHVVCRESGYTAAQSVTTGSSFGSGEGRIWLDEVRCTGTEASIANCLHAGYGNNNCNHMEDAGVVCSADNETIRLVGGPTASAGRVEIFSQSKWGTVCDDGWDIEDAQVVCRQLGLGSAFDAPVGAYFGEGTGQIWLDDVQCTGNETNLLQCTSRILGIHNCGHGEDAGVRCLPKADNETIRLVGGPTSMAGRVEIFMQDQWGTICDDRWDIEDAQVVCRQLGLGSAFDAPVEAFFGEGAGQIWLHDVRCTGNEAILLRCTSQTLGLQNCNHAQDAGVKCLLKGSTAAIEAVRLTGGSTSAEGRVEISIQGEWGTICYKNWDINDAKVVCRQLGFQSAVDATAGDVFGEGSGRIWLDDVQCTGNEETISDCTSRNLGTHNCYPGREAGVKCLLEVKISHIILTRGMNPEEGIVEISVDEIWRTLCDDDHWGVANSYVVCRQLGYDSAVTLRKGSSALRETARASDYYFQCSGEERRLDDCVVGRYDNEYTCNTRVVYVVCLSHSTGKDTAASYSWSIVIAVLFLVIAVCIYIGFKLYNRGWFTKPSTKNGVNKRSTPPSFRRPLQNASSRRGGYDYETIDGRGVRDGVTSERTVSVLFENQSYELMLGNIGENSTENCGDSKCHSYARKIIKNDSTVTVDDTAKVDSRRTL
ncbi:Deleted in malignant brain tumors 1 protein [Holothuria leucospilota]|uniref:Deleted in malignant brain tumors 1 protein n=1 Tax=Holothuria leucospilota TaxID=206669 RepID=A0A9Q0YTX0_HOLLE|nr:Deleted in malignant brain tumors 1 protein [Holothuria leucospilota]